MLLKMVSIMYVACETRMNLRIILVSKLNIHTYKHMQCIDKNSLNYIKLPYLFG